VARADQPAADLRSDNGPEFIAKEVQHWLASNHIKTIYIDPGSPWQNGFVERFYGRFRDSFRSFRVNECLNREQLWTQASPKLRRGEHWLKPVW